MSLVKPKLFVSYSRENSDAAKRIHQALRDGGYGVFMDEAELLVGEHFPRRLQEELVKCDALVFLHTVESAGSEWCKAELYAAHALGLQVLRLRQAGAPPLSEPLEQMLRDLHFLEWDGVHPPPLREHLQRAHGHANRRFWKRATGAAVAAGLLVALGVLFFSRWDTWQLEQRRDAAVTSIEESTRYWNLQQLGQALDRLQGDPAMLARTRGLVDDPEANNTARFNAWQAAQYLASSQARHERWDLSGIDWRGASLEDAFLADATIRDGSIGETVLADCTLAGLYLGPAPGELEDGLSLVSTRFERCDFWNTRFDHTQIISGEFIDSKFRGVQIGLRGFANVVFRSSDDDGVVITPDYALFEDSLIIGLEQGPEPGVIDLSTPEHEVVFDGVEFVRVTFEGWFRPTWFRDSHFVDCTFPDTFPLSEVAAGNDIEGAATPSIR